MLLGTGSSRPKLGSGASRIDGAQRKLFRHFALLSTTQTEDIGLGGRG